MRREDDFNGIIIRKYTNKEEIREEYLIYKMDNGKLKCDCFRYQREGKCKHENWLNPILL